MPKLINQFTSENVQLAHKLIQQVLTLRGINGVLAAHAHASG